MFTTNIPSYTIDLEQPATQCWEEVIARETNVARNLVQEAGKHFERVPRLVRWAFDRLYQKSGGLYRDEIGAWAAALGVQPGTVTILNCAYEMSHLRWPKVFGCSAGIRWTESLGLVHVRCLDWPLATMGAATRIFRFRRGEREFVSIGVPGQVGLLSGMLPHAYSVSINWAPPVAFPCFDFGPTFLLRDVLEKCNSYDEAVRTLTETPLSTSVFFAVCGLEPGQACVIERTQREAAVRPLAGPVLVQTNHHVAARFANNNGDIIQGESKDDVFSLAGSTLRAQTFSKSLANVAAPHTLDTLASALNHGTVLNGDTCQQMVFCPARGEMKAWRRAEG